MNIFAIDPGTTQSAIVRWNGEKIYAASILSNTLLLDSLHICGNGDEVLYIEMIASYGMPVGKETFETCVWIGRFLEAWENANKREGKLVYRRDIKMHHCGSARAKDSNIHQALVDKYGQKGTKSNPGLTYPLKHDMWAAFALATFVSEQSVCVMQ